MLYYTLHVRVPVWLTLWSLSSVLNSSCNTHSEFQCANGECIDYELACDGVAHCKDKSDEKRQYCGERERERLYFCLNCVDYTITPQRYPVPHSDWSEGVPGFILMRSYRNERNSDSEHHKHGRVPDVSFPPVSFKPVVFQIHKAQPVYSPTHKLRVIINNSSAGGYGM